MSSNYRTIPLKVCAAATGGASVNVVATLFVDDQTTQEGAGSLANVHIDEQCAELSARKKTGTAVLHLLFIVVPLVGNGEFEVTVTVSHPNIPASPVTIKRSGDAPDVPKKFQLRRTLP